MQTFRDAFAYRDVLMALTAKELKAQYRNMALGFLWALLNPLVMIAVLSFALVVFMGQGKDAPARIVVALIPYNFFTYCVSACTSSVTGNSSLVKKIWFPRQILPFSVILTSLVHFGVQSLLVVLVLVLFPHDGDVLTFNLLWLLPVLVVHIGLCIGLGMLVAALNVVFRDTRYLVESLLTVLFWLSPVIYDARNYLQISTGDLTWLQRAYFLNPVAGTLDSYRAVLFYGTVPDPFVFGSAVVLTALIGAIGMLTFWRHERQFADLIQ